MLAEYFEVLGGVPAVVLAGRISCWKAVWSRTSWSSLARTTSVRCALRVPAGLLPRERPGVQRDGGEPARLCQRYSWFRSSPSTIWVSATLGSGGVRGGNGAVNSEMCAVPAERLATERELLAPLPSLRPSIGRLVTRKVDRLSCIRLVRRATVASALIDRMSGSGSITTGPWRSSPATGRSSRSIPLSRQVRRQSGERSGGPRPVTPLRAVRPSIVAEKDFCALGPVAEAFIAGAAASGNTRLGPELAELNMLRAATATNCSSPRSTGRSRSADGAR